MKKIKCLFSILLCIVMLLVTIPTFPSKVKALTLNDLKSNFPQGSYWNHEGTAYSTYNSNRESYNLKSTSTPCNHSKYGNVHCSYNNWNYSGQCGCNSYGGSTQCMGFARFVCYKLFGYAPNGDGSAGNNWKSTTFDNLKVGDYIRYKRYYGHYGHSVIVSGKSSDSITVLECNYDDKCGISWNRTITRSTLAGYYSVKYLTAGGTSGVDLGNNPQGVLDSVTGGTNSITVRGWAFDKDNINQAIEVHVYIGGAAGSSSGEGHGGIVANTSRSDVNDVYGCGNNHGFETTISTSKTGTQTVYAYAINIGGGENVFIGQKTVNISNVSLVNNTSYSGLLPMKAYLKGTSTVYPCKEDCSTQTGGQIWATDECTINAIYTNGWCQVTYPGNGGNKTAYTPLSNFMGTGLTKKTAQVKMTTYSRADGATSIGSVFAGDICYVTGTSGSYTQVIYPTSSGYKLGWCVWTNASATDTRFNPYCKIYSYILSSTDRLSTYESDRSTYAGQIFVDDYSTIEAVYSDGWCLVTYPAGGGTKTKYAPLSGFVADTSYTPKSFTCTTRTAVYTKPGPSAFSEWYIDPGDVFFQVSESGGTSQVLYPVPGGYKLGWIYTSQIPFPTYTVSYNANGGTGAPSAQTKTQYQDLVLSSTVPTRSGYTFAGWATSSSATSATYRSGATYTNDAGITLYAVWTPNKYTITYNANGGTNAPSSQTKIHGTNITLSSVVPVKKYTVEFDACNEDENSITYYPDCSFAGWATSSTATTASYASGSTYTTNSNTILYAVWTNPSVGSLPVVYREGYDFEGWYTAVDGGSKITASTKITSNTKYYAHWTECEYLLVFDANGGSCSVSSQAVTYNNAYGTLPTPTRTGYKFLGWYTDADGGSEIHSTDIYTYKDNQDLYAHWTPNTYKVTLNNISATTAGTAAYWYKYNTATDGNYYYSNEGCSTVLTNYTITCPTKTGYSFGGYFTGENGTGTKYIDNTGKCVNDIYKTVGSKTLYAYWIPNTYTVTYNANGGTGAPSAQTKTHGTDLTLSSTKPTRSVTITLNANGGSVSPTSKSVSYTFNNWKATDGTIYASGATYTANEGTTLTAQWTNPLAYALPTPSKTGYTFVGWNTKSDGTGTNYSGGTSYSATSNVTLYAQWTAKTYTVSYNANGGTGAPSAQTKTYGTDLTLSSTKPTRSVTVTYELNGGALSSASKSASYTFKNWKATDGTIYASGATYTANEGTTLTAQWTNPLAYALPTPSKTGYTFVGWNTKSDGTGTNYPGGSSYSATANVTLYAQWTKSQYTITFNPNGGTCSIESKTVTVGETYGDLPEAIKADSIFTGWYTSAALTTEITATTIVNLSSDQTLYARFRAPDVTGISIQSMPAKTVYEKGENIDLTGLKVIAVYENGSTKDVPSNSLEVTGFDSNSAGIKTIHIKYNGKETTFNITVNETMPENAPKFVVSSVKGSRGKTVEVPVRIENNPGIIATKIAVSYDNTKVKLVNVIDGSLLGSNMGMFCGDIDSVPFTALWENALTRTNCYDNGVLITFVFEILDDAEEGITPISLTYEKQSTFNIDLDDVDFAVINGQIDITSRLPGDVNDDGEVTLKDVVILKRFLATGWDVEINESNADVNQDGIVSLKDSTILERFLATGWNVELK